MKYLYLISINLILLFPVVVLGNAHGGGTYGSPVTTTIVNPLLPSLNNIPAIIVAILDVLLIIALPIIIFFIVYAGFVYVTSQGNPSKISEANRALFYALIGGVIILGARIIGGVVQSTVNGLTGSP